MPQLEANTIDRIAAVVNGVLTLVNLLVFLRSSAPGKYNQYNTHTGENKTTGTGYRPCTKVEQLLKADQWRLIGHTGHLYRRCADRGYVHNYIPSDKSQPGQPGQTTGNNLPR